MQRTGKLHHLSFHFYGRTAWSCQCAVSFAAANPPLLQERATGLRRNTLIDRWTTNRHIHRHTHRQTCTIRAWRAPGSCMSLTFNYLPNGLTVVSLDRGGGREGARGRKEGMEGHWSSENEWGRIFRLCLFYYGDYDANSWAEVREAVKRNPSQFSGGFSTLSDRVEAFVWIYLCIWC